jgi:hypothetical protein
MSTVGDTFNREDRPAYVRFERRVIEDKAASLQQGRYVAKDIDFALVTPPYSKDCVEYKVTQWMENVRKNVRDERIPKGWMDQWFDMYEKWKNGQEMPLNGTPIRGWGVISPAQQEMLIRMNCMTIEDLAAANDEGIRRIGIGAIELKNKAKAWLGSMKDHGAVTIEVSALKQENEILKASLDHLQKQIEALKAAIPVQPTHGEYHEQAHGEITASDLLEEPVQTVPAVEVKRRGRPPKEQTIETV